MLPHRKTHASLCRPKFHTLSGLDDGNQNRRLDRAAIFISGLCLVHCLAIPVALLLGTVAGDWLLATETHVHWLLLGIAAPVSIWALGRGYRDHGNGATLALGLTGLVLMLLGVSHLFGTRWEVTLTLIGVIAVMVAHVRNAMTRSRHSHG